MKTVIDFEDEVLQLLLTQAVKASAGDMYKSKRPIEHRGPALVVVSLPATGGQLQQAVVNVNIHKPNLSIRIEGKSDNTQPDRKNLNATAGIVIPFLEDAFINGSDVVVEAITLFEEPEFNEHFLNIRVQIFSPNI